jgi:hypothetical protein
LRINIYENSEYRYKKFKEASKAGLIAPSITTVRENKYQSNFSRKQKDLDGYPSAGILSQSKNTVSAAQRPNFLTFIGAHESIPRNQIRQTIVA